MGVLFICLSVYFSFSLQSVTHALNSHICSLHFLFGLPDFPSSRYSHKPPLVVNMDSIKGKYQRVSAEKYEEFLKALDVSFMMRKAATVSTPVMEVSGDAGVWTIKTSTTLKTMELKFKIGEEFDETTPDGREVTAKVTHDGNKLVTEQKAKKDGQKSTKSIREFNGDEVVYTLTIDGIDDLVCVQKFKR